MSEDERPLPPHLDPRRGSRRLPPASGAADVVARRPGRPRWQRVLAWTAVVTSVALLVGSGGLYLLYRHYDSQIDRVPLTALGPGDGADVDGEDQNFLVVGNSSREGLTDAELALARTEDDGNAGVLTDTVLLVHVPGDGSSAKFVSFPRDSWVQVPGIEGRNKINAAYALGEVQQPGSGPDSLVATVSQLSGLAIDHYVEVDFLAFLRITDAVGGVSVTLCDDVSDPDSGFVASAGTQQLDGQDALSFVRQRKGLVNELGRIERQQYFIGRLADKVLSSSTLLRPDRVTGLLDAVTASLTTDEDLSSRDLQELALRLRGAATGAIQFQTVPISDVDGRADGQDVVLLDEPALPAFFAELSPEQAPEPEPSVPLLPAAEVTVEVQNGTQRAGLAAGAAGTLAGLGFVVSGTTQADEASSTTVVRYGAGGAAAAATVAASVPGATLQADETLGANEVALVLGGDFEAVASGVPAPEPEAEPTEPPRTAADEGCIA